MSAAGRTREQEILRRGPVSKAWARATDGFAAALAVEGLPADERARLLRCHALAAQKAGRPILRDADEAELQLRRSGTGDAASAEA